MLAFMILPLLTQTGSRSSYSRRKGSIGGSGGVGTAVAGSRFPKESEKVKLDGHVIKPNRTIRKRSNFKSLYAYGAIKLSGSVPVGGWGGWGVGARQFMAGELGNIDHENERVIGSLKTQKPVKPGIT